ncbi:MAG: DUF2849 domain-containing protein [Luminiphilus sp.]|nr:DUF2849 domain-containing protein [Luminiphilus sp.]
MARLDAPAVVTANCLLAGHVLYLSETQEWVTQLSAAHRFDCLEAAKVMAAKVNDPSRVIGVELVGVSTSPGETVARHYREAIRANGPGAYVFAPPIGEGDVSVQ